MEFSPVFDVKKRKQIYAVLKGIFWVEREDCSVDSTKHEKSDSLKEGPMIFLCLSAGKAYAASRIRQKPFRSFGDLTPFERVLLLGPRSQSRHRVLA